MLKGSPHLIRKGPVPFTVVATTNLKGNWKDRLSCARVDLHIAVTRDLQTRRRFAESALAPI